MQPEVPIKNKRYKSTLLCICLTNSHWFKNVFWGSRTVAETITYHQLSITLSNLEQIILEEEAGEL